MQYIKQLDSLRAIAVLFVIFHHWKPAQHVNRFSLGAMGVYIFFVISGFLISSILLFAKKDHETNHTSKKTILKSFYLRRVLRIFPLYYFAITLGYILQNHINLYVDFEKLLPYLATFTTNYYFLFNETWGGLFSHFWSLAVEEQFYLIWPWILVYCHKKYLPVVIIIFIFIGIGHQYLSNYKIEQVGISTLSCFDALGLGSLLAFYYVYHPPTLIKFQKVLAPLGIIILVLFLMKYLFLYGVIFIPNLPLGTSMTIMTTALINHFIVNHQNNNFIEAFFFKNKILIWMGKLSYGLYVYHYFIPEIFGPIIFGQNTQTFKNQNFSLNHSLQFVTYLLISLFISFISYRFLEQRFLKLKNLFKY
ncbi:acyltransferase [Mangrovimonas sp. ST2L15]|uniref:acyltransferase family protein n=1 Tax=Mangrovimonas sp. ST2L15 TaxID=1645916 RepID=UPI0006B4FC70|nr:acyltransferase [Mangrovimonas sp. ST2L15]